LLGELNGSENIEYLLKLKTEIKNRAAHKAIEKALVRARRKANSMAITTKLNEVYLNRVKF